MGLLQRPTVLLTLAVTLAVVHRAASAGTPSWTPLDGNVTAPARTRRVAVYDVHVRHDDDRDDVLLAALQRARTATGGSVRPAMHKATLTQIGYIQFLRYVVEVPELRELSFCVWLRSRNLTHNHPIFSYSLNEKERLARAWVSPAGAAGPGGRRLPPRLHLSVLERTVFVEPLPEAAHRRWLHICPSWDGRSGQYHLYVDGRMRRAGSRPEAAGLVLPAGGDVVVGQEYTDFDKGLDDGVEGDVFGFHLFRTATPPHGGQPTQPSESEHHFDEDLQRQLLRTRRWANYPDALQRRRRPLTARLPPPQRRRSSEETADAVAESATGPRPKRQGWRQGWQLGPAGPYSPPKDLTRVPPPRVQRLYAKCEERLADQDRAEAVVAWTTSPVRVFGGAILSNVNRGCGDF